ncbi:hypothetical protein AVEN_94952-1 [Araneus ventricosus]|uniref:25S rRNA (uridine-N(3))-methyltransferase BMT5-like domain-containing protein n=1 Tax=Araneus ventricosus TaxID=182803 RepID=A0A4Y2DJX0_ARAVE|nr:hypothetical protein AVEN_94952-1 [Araneus ventricosus]
MKLPPEESEPPPQEHQLEYIPPVQERAKYVLFAGDHGGGATFRLAYACLDFINLKNKPLHVVVTVPERRTCEARHLNILKDLKKRGAAVSTVVDITRLERHLIVQRHTYEKIYFYFPRIDVSFVSETQNIMKNFFLSSVFDGIDADGAVTHIFQKDCLQAPYTRVSKRIPEVLRADQQEYFNQSVKEVYEFQSEKRGHPFTKIVYALDKVAKSSSAPLETIFLKKMLSYENVFVPGFKLDAGGKRRIHFAISQYLKFKGNICNTTSLIYCVHSAKYFLDNFCPFRHFLTYFSADFDSIRQIVSAIMRQLHSDIPEDTPEFIWNNTASILNSREVSATPDTTPSYSFSAICRNIRALMAYYTVNEKDMYTYYDNLKIEVQSYDNSMELHKRHFEIGNIFEFEHSEMRTYGILLNLEKLSVLKFHIAEERVLLSSGYFCERMMDGASVLIYRPVSLYPPIHRRVITLQCLPHPSALVFENNLLLVLWNVAREVVKSCENSVKYDESTDRMFTIFYLQYMSYDKVLSDNCVGKIQRRVFEVMNYLMEHES